MKKKSILKKFGITCMCAAMLATMAVPAFADNGVQNPAPNGYNYTTTDANGTGAWDANDGKIDLTYDTTGGTWKDSQYPDSGTAEQQA